MAKRTTPQQRRSFYERHLRGETYQAIADSEEVSKGCVRYWCRHQRDGGSCQTAYHRQEAGLLGRFDPLVRYVVLRLRLEHPRWGPDRILAGLKKRLSLRGKRLPSRASIGRYFHQWPRFRRQSNPAAKGKRPNQPAEVHQRWQLDFRQGLSLANGTPITLCNLRDPVGEAGIGSFAHVTELVGKGPRHLTFPEVRTDLRACFARWNTLPEEIQTDNVTELAGKPQDTFPSPFTLWLKGLGIDHLLTRPGCPTDNAEGERFHRTLVDYAIFGSEFDDQEGMQKALDQALDELNFELSSRAKGCGGRPPVEAHPELLQPRRPFKPEWELAYFDLGRVDAYLSTFTWERLVSKTGQITLGGRHKRYTVGRSHAGQTVWVKFDPQDRHFVFYDADERELGRRPAHGLEIEDLTGLGDKSNALGPQQLRLPLFELEGVNC